MGLAVLNVVMLWRLKKAVTGYSLGVPNTRSASMSKLPMTLNRALSSVLNVAKDTLSVELPGMAKFFMPAMLIRAVNILSTKNR
jgi:hypothetical protein